MAQTKAQRRASAKKAAATRKRNAAKKSARDLKGPARSTAGRVTDLAKAAGSAAETAAKSVTKQVEAIRGGGAAKRKRHPQERLTHPLLGQVGRCRIDLPSARGTFVLVGGEATAWVAGASMYLRASPPPPLGL